MPSLRGGNRPGRPTDRRHGCDLPLLPSDPQPPDALTPRFRRSATTAPLTTSTAVLDRSPLPPAARPPRLRRNAGPTTDGDRRVDPEDRRPRSLGPTLLRPRPYPRTAMTPDDFVEALCELGSRPRFCRRRAPERPRRGTPPSVDGRPAPLAAHRVRARRPRSPSSESRPRRSGAADRRREAQERSSRVVRGGHWLVGTVSAGIHRLLAPWTSG